MDRKADMHSMRKGTNASGMRRYNERLILSAIRRFGGASKADLSRVAVATGSPDAGAPFDTVSPLISHGT